jgi:hypothetical protein
LSPSYVSEKLNESISLATVHGVVFDVLCFGRHRQSVIRASTLIGNAAT